MEAQKPPVGFKRKPTFEIVFVAIILYLIALFILKPRPLVPHAPTPSTCQTCP